MKSDLLLLSLVLCLTLTSCAPGPVPSPAGSDPSVPITTETPIPDAPETLIADSLLNSGAFSDTLEQFDLEPDALCAIYGLSADAVEAAVAYGDVGMGSETIAVFRMKDGGSVADALSSLELYVTAQRDEQISYNPDEVPKLDAAIITRKGRCVVLAVADDPVIATATLNEIKKEA